MKKYMMVFAATVALLIQTLSAKPVKIVFDTDMGNDVDDALALVMLNAYADAGKIDFLCCVVNKDNKYAPVYVNIVNEFYGRGSLPIYMVSDGATKKDGNFNKRVSEAKDENGIYKYSRKLDADSELLSAVKGLRKTLSKSDDGSVVYISVGFSTNVAELLKSEPDDISPLTGAELVAKKVRYFSVMAGEFSGKANPEYNVIKDIPAFKYFVENSPVPIIFSGFEVGAAILMPHDSVDECFSKFKGGSPVWDAYNLYAEVCAKKPKGRHDRPSWDMTSVLYVVEPSSFDLSEAGTISVDDKGITSFTKKADGKHRFMLVPNAREIENIVSRFRTLCGHQPAISR